MTPLRRKLTSQGISLCSISRETGVHKAHVSSFVNGHLERVPRHAKVLIRQNLIAWGFLPRPKPRKPPVCRQCGCEYPTRTQSNHQQSSPQA
jgi:hypothetical protein